MVNVEADVLAGPLLAEEARRAGVVYSLAYGDQPALIAELVDWARAIGFRVVAAGKGTKYLPHYHAVTPDDVWEHYGLTPEEARRAGMNPQMFNSFLDGTKSAIEMAAIANATGLDVPEDGLAFPPCGVDDLPHVLRPRAAGGVLDHAGVDGGRVLARTRRPAGVPRPALGRLCGRRGAERLCRGMLAAIRHEDRRERALRGAVPALSPDRPGTRHFGAVRGAARRADRPARANSAPTWPRSPSAGCARARCWTARAATPCGAGAMPAAASLRSGALPIGLAHHARLLRDVAAGEVVRWIDVAIGADALTASATAARRELEARQGATAPKEPASLR